MWTRKRKGLIREEVKDRIAGRIAAIIRKTADRAVAILSRTDRSLSLQCRRIVWAVFILCGCIYCCGLVVKAVFYPAKQELKHHNVPAVAQPPPHSKADSLKMPLFLAPLDPLPHFFNHKK